MGSFSYICSASKNYISHGDDVVAFFIGEKFLNGESRYSPDPRPVGSGAIFFPIFGKYNDYGWLEDIEDNFNNKLLHKLLENHWKEVCPDQGALGIFKNFLEHSRGFYTCQCLPADISHQNPKFKQHNYYPDRVELEAHNGTRAKYVLFHRKIYDQLIENGRNFWYYIGKELTRTPAVSDDEYTKRNYVSFGEYDLKKFSQKYVKYLLKNIDFDHFVIDKNGMTDEKTWFRKHQTQYQLSNMNALFKGYDPLAERTQQERKPITAEEALFQEANKIVFASFDSLDPKPFIYKGTQNYFFKEFLSYLESNDIKSATSFIEEYLKVIFLFRALEEQNTTYDGRNTDHAGHQYASESVLVNSVNYKLVAIEQTIDRIADNNLDFGEEELSMEKVKEKLKELIKKMEDYENASRASIC